MADYDSSYYESNEQSGDRPALDYYYRLFKNSFTRTQHGRPKVLEYGCGVGHLTKRLIRDFDCYALDISKYALTQVNQNAPAAKTIESTKGIKENELDAVIALHVFEHIKEPLVTFQDLYGKLKKGGTLMYVVPNPDGYGHALKKGDWFGFDDDTHISLFSEKKWIELTEKGGFKIIKVRGDGMWDVPYVRGIPIVLQKLFFFPMFAPQFLLGRAYLPTKIGECLIVIAQKD